MKDLSSPRPKGAIVDYGLGNLFSIRRACDYAGISVTVTSSKEEILGADLVILPGVGAFGDAMATLNRLDLIGVLQDVAASGKHLVGICLGVQLLMTESSEFGRHRGLGIIEGPVVRFENPLEESRLLKVPQVQWNRIVRPEGPERKNEGWKGTPLEGVVEGEFFYFVHSFYVCPTDRSVVLSMSRYGGIEFCSSLRQGNVFACQFHPERSGPVGLKIYNNIARIVGVIKGERAA